MKLFKLYARRNIHWDGSDETAGKFGYGDYSFVEHDFLTIIPAKNEQEARKQARRFFKTQLKKKCLFSGVGYTAFLEEIKQEI